MGIPFIHQYPLSSPGSDGQIIPLDVSRPEWIFSLCFTTIAMAAPLALNTAWDILEFWATEPCIISFNAASVIKPDGIGTTVPDAYLIRKNSGQDRIILTKSADFLSVVGIENPGELFVSVLTRYEAIAIDQSLTVG
jgi:hypothetical protein